MPKSITCPSCFEIYPVDHVKFRCTNAQCPDFNQVFDGPEPAKGPLALLRPVVTEAPCPTCEQVSFKRLCPYCGFELMHDAGITEEHTVAVIGGRSTGKSTYIAALVHRLKNEVGMNFEAGVGAMNDHTRQRYRDEFEVPLFREHRLLAATQSASVDPTAKTPMIFRITFQGRRRAKAVNLVLFDTAGEDMQSLDMMSAEARYICFTDGLIFLLDPLQIDAVRQLLHGTEIDLPERVPGSEPKLIVERLRQLYERQFRLKGTQKIKKPVAFTLAKIDALFSLIDPSSTLHRSGEHFGYLNRADVESVHTEITNYLLTWMGAEFDTFARINFDNYHYFGVSALGQPPTNNSLETVSPHRVEDPLLWIFYQFGLIKDKK